MQSSGFYEVDAAGGGNCLFGSLAYLLLHSRDPMCRAVLERIARLTKNNPELDKRLSDVVQPRPPSAPLSHPHHPQLCAQLNLQHQQFLTRVLRCLVGTSVFSPAEGVRSVINGWVELYLAGSRDPEIEVNYRHVRSALDPLSRTIDLYKLCGNLCNQGLYWGDEYAIWILERLLNVRIEVHQAGTGGKAAVLDHQEMFVPDGVLHVMLRHNHYTALLPR